MLLTMGRLRRHAAKEKLSVSAGDGYGAWAQIYGKTGEVRKNTTSFCFFHHFALLHPMVFRCLHKVGAHKDVIEYICLQPPTRKI